jgi:2-hydroxychromene-2-carboxylate isomerase
MLRRPIFEFWYEFASTYSYLAVMRIEQLAAEAGVELVWRPFLLGPVFKAQGWETSPFKLFPDKGRYMWRDLEREAARLGLPFYRPKSFPQNGLLAARIAILGTETGWTPLFTIFPIGTSSPASSPASGSIRKKSSRKPSPKPTRPACIA